jgi:hypothetical protein
MNWFVIVAAFFCLSSCSPRQANQGQLPNYSDMGAAADAGKIQP